MKHLLAATIAFACLVSPAFAATVAVTPASYWNTLSAAQPGDVLQLQAGDYGDLNAKNFPKAAPGVTLQPAPGAMVAMGSINASGSTNLTFTDFDVTMKPTTQYGVTVGSGGQGVVFDRVKVHQADGSLLQGVGFWVRNAAGVTVRNSEFYWLGIGGGVMDSDKVTVAANHIHDVKTDGIMLSGTTNALVTRNLIHDHHPTAGDHPDGIQFFNTAAHATDRLEISANRVERGAGGIIQGIFGEDGANVAIHDNELLGTMYNGIGLSRTQGAEITRNFVAGYPDMATRIIVRNACDRVAISGNTAQQVVNYVAAGETPCSNVTLAGNTIIGPAAGPGDYAALNAWKGTSAPAATAPPVVASPAPNPLQATVDSLTTQVADLTAKLSAAQASLAAANAKIAQAQAALK